jgi:hypothetical protein
LSLNIIQERLAQDPKFDDCTLVPVIWGADKTVASVATGHSDFYPLYMSNGIIHNDMRRAHIDGLDVVALLPIPKCEPPPSCRRTTLNCTKGGREFEKTVAYRKFIRQMYHTARSEIYQSLLSSMENPELVLFPDDFYRKIVTCAGPEISDYPDQVQAAGVVSGSCV